jgi:hypothetical protein
MANRTVNVNELGSDILDDVHNPIDHALRVDANFSGGTLDIDSLTDSIAIGDSVTGVKAKVNASGEILVSTTGDVNANFPPPTDFAPRTVTVTTSPQAITIPGITITSVALKALGENAGYIRIGKSNVLSSPTNFYLLSPGESLNLPLAASTEPIYYVIDVDSPPATYKLTFVAVN